MHRSCCSVWPCHCPDPRRDYERFLFPLLKLIEYQRHGARPPKHIKPQCIATIPVFTPPLSGELTRKFWKDLLGCQVAILRGFTEHIWKLDLSLYTFSAISRNHPDAETAYDRNTVKLSDFQFSKQDAKSAPSKLKAVVDISAWEDLMCDLTCNLPDLLLFDTHSDLLTYSRNHVPGITLPVISMKLPGHWFGISTAPLSLCSLNISTGKGVVEWWVMGSEAAAHFRQYLLTTRNMDILHSEVDLWPDENFLMIEGLQTFHGRQLKGDILYLGPGSCTWGKTKTTCIDVNWKFGMKTEQQISGMMQREEIERSLGQNCGVNVWTLILDYLNSELGSMSLEVANLIMGKLETRYLQETSQIESSGLPNLGVNARHEISNCQICKQSLFYAYTRCEVCSYCVCLSCAHKHTHPLLVCYTLFPPHAFDRLRSRVEARRKGDEMDCFDPALQVHLDLEEKCKDMYLSPCHGVPSYSLFSLNESNPTTEKPQKRVRTHTKTRLPRSTHTSKQKHKMEMLELADLLDPTEDNDSQEHNSISSGPDELPD